MKKFSLLTLCLTAGLAMSAQTAVVDEVKHMLGQSKPNYEDALAKIQPALSDPSTMNTAMPWYLAGKSAFGVYDTYYLQQQLGNDLNNDQKSKAGKAMIEGYNDYFVAIPLDVEMDKKTGQPKLNKDGSVKQGKQVKEMQKTLRDNYQHLLTAGVMLYEVQDYQGAYDVWQLYVDLPTNELLGTDKPTADPDSLVGQIMYFQLLAALINGEDAKALSKFYDIEKTSYKNIDAYVYGLQAANRLNDSVAVLNIARKGYELYGTQTPDFIGQLINEKLDAEDYPECVKMLNEAIKACSDDDKEVKCQLINILGVVYERQDNLDKAYETFIEGTKVDPEFAKNYFDAGRMRYNQAVDIDEKNGDEYNVAPEAKTKFLEAAELFEKAYGLDEDNFGNIPNLLYTLYYRLGAGYEDQMKYWESLR